MTCRKRSGPKAAAALISAALFCISAFPLSAEEPDFKAILARIDTMTRFDDSDFSCIYTAFSQKPGKDLETVQARYFRRDKEKKFLVLVLQPDVQKGQGYLRVDDNLWFYDPESRKFSHSSMKENFQNSDAKNSDFEASSLTEDYSIGGYSEGKLGAFDVWTLELQAKNDEVTYPMMTLTFRKDNYLVLKAQEYSKSKRLMRTAYYPSYIKIRDRYLPNKMIFVDELVEGEKTEVNLKDASLSALPDSVFTKAYLEKVSR